MIIIWFIGSVLLLSIGWSCIRLSWHLLKDTQQLIPEFNRLQVLVQKYNAEKISRSTLLLNDPKGFIRFGLESRDGVLYQKAFISMKYFVQRFSV